MLLVPVMISFMTSWTTCHQSGLPVARGDVLNSSLFIVRWEDEMSANIRSIEALVEFRAALIVFIEDASLALQTMTMELHKSYEWIEHERPYYWNAQVRRGFDQVSQTRAALESCRMRIVAGHRPSCMEEKQAYARAKQRLQHCQDQIKAVKQWANKVRHEADEFRGRMATLQALLEGDLPKAVATLENAISILESYSETARPQDFEE